MGFGVCGKHKRQKQGIRNIFIHLFTLPDIERIMTSCGLSILKGKARGSGKVYVLGLW